MWDMGILWAMAKDAYVDDKIRINGLLIQRISFNMAIQ
jgi:hypothetical protein